MKNVKWIGAVVLMSVFLALSGCSEPEGSTFIGRWEVDSTLVDPYTAVRAVEIERDGADFKVQLNQRRIDDRVSSSFVETDWELLTGKAVLESVPPGPWVGGKRLLLTNFGRGPGEARIQYLWVDGNGMLIGDSVRKFVKKP